MLQNGQAAPGLTLPDADMELVKLSDYKNKKHVVLYFYPKDDTPGCTREAIDFSDLEQAFARLDTVVLGVSKDDCISHAAFRDKHGLAVRFLADIEGRVCKRYGVWQEKESDGVKRMGIVRSTFVIDKQGVVRHAMYGISVKGHAAEILDRVRKLG